MQAIKTTDLVKQYKKITAVDKLDLEIHEGELFSLLGVNGAGKTTTIKILSCLTQPTAGDAFVGGYDVTKESKQVKRLISVSPQETAIAPNLTVKENLEFMAGVYQISNKENKINELISKFKLEEILNKKAKTLSGGWQRRLSIAISLINDPKILILDEPTLGLDVIARKELWNVINELKGKITIILTTHYMEEAEILSDRIGIMANGELIAVGTVEELINKVNAKSFEDAFVSIATGGRL